MSRRSDRRRGAGRRESEVAPGEGGRKGAGQEPAAERGRSGGGARSGVAAARRGDGWGLGVQLAFLAAVFALVAGVAELAGAANLGVALGVGQIAFAIAVMYVLLRR